MNCGSSHPKTSASAAITIAGLSKRLHRGRATGVGDVLLTKDARPHCRASIGALAETASAVGPCARASTKRPPVACARAVATDEAEPRLDAALAHAPLLLREADVSTGALARACSGRRAGGDPTRRRRADRALRCPVRGTACGTTLSTRPARRSPAVQLEARRGRCTPFASHETEHPDRPQSLFVRSGLGSAVVEKPACQGERKALDQELFRVGRCAFRRVGGPRVRRVAFASGGRGLNEWPGRWSAYRRRPHRASMTCTRVATTAGSNCVPEQRRSSASAASMGIAGR